MRYRTRKQCLSCSWRAVQQDTLGLRYTERLEQLWMLQTQLDDLLNLLDLLIETTNHIVRAIWHLLDHHERNERVDRRRQKLLELVRVAEEGYALAGCEFANVDVVGNVNNCGRQVSWLVSFFHLHDIPYLPSGCTFTSTFFVPMTLTTSPTY